MTDRFVVTVPITEEQADVIGIPASVFEQAVRRLGRKTGKLTEEERLARHRQFYANMTEEQRARKRALNSALTRRRRAARTDEQRLADNAKSYAARLKKMGKERRQPKYSKLRPPPIWPEDLEP